MTDSETDGGDAAAGPASSPDGPAGSTSPDPTRGPASDGSGEPTPEGQPATDEVEAPGGREADEDGESSDERAVDSGERLAPSEAFQALGSEVRTAVLAELADAERADETRSFSELFEASGVDTSAGFAYHLRQLDDHYVRQNDDGYALTYAGREAARAMEAGTFTDSVDRPPVPVEDPCPFCEADALELRSADNHASVACRDCERALLTLPFPPGGHRSHDDSELPEAFDRHHRHRISVLADGGCPDCGGAVASSIRRAASELLEDASERPLVRMTCSGCGLQLACPGTLTVLDHPAVVSFYRDHGEDVGDRPLWNVGTEWRETVVSDDPWCVLVSTRLDDEVLDVYLDGDGGVAATRRSELD